MEVTVRVLPLGVAVRVAPDESVMEGAERHGLVWPSVCRGLAQCGTCWVTIEAGAEHASEVAPKERDRLDRQPRSRQRRARLACQLRVSGEMTVRRRGVALGPHRSQRDGDPEAWRPPERGERP